MSQKIRRIVILFVLAAGGYGAYRYLNQDPRELILTGIVTTHDVVLSPQIGGRLESLAVTEGQSVHKGQVVALIATDELQAERAYALHQSEGMSSQVQESQAALRYEQRQMTEQIRQAQSTLASYQAQEAAAVADLERARLNLERMAALARDGVVPAQQLDEARTGQQAAQARVDAIKKQVEAQRASIDLVRTNAEQVAVKKSQVRADEAMQAAAVAQRVKADARLAYAEVRSPIDGVVDVRAARPGEYVGAGQPVATLINPDDLWVRADVEESYIDRVKLGDHMKVRLPSGTEVDGEVIYRGVDAGFATQRDVSRTKRDVKTFEIRLRCDNSARRLAVGMTAYVLLPLR